MKGWLDNFGKANNANESNVSLPEGFVGLGYDTKGRNYSPAWGGQFAMGGSLPGATGMMYARYEEGGLIPIAQNGKLVPVSPLQQIQQAVEPTPTVPYLQTKDPSEFYKSWIQNPEYERRLKATGYSDVPNRWNSDKLSEIEKVKKERLNLLENIQPLEYDRSKRSEAIIDYYDGSTINVNPSDYKGSARQSVEAHEIAHVATPPGTMGGNEFGIFMESLLPLKKPIVSGVQGSKEREASIEAVGDFEHASKPWEAKADLDALRFMMYDKGIYDITKGKKFTETDFEKAKQNLGNDRVFKRLENRMGKKNFVKLMNTIALADDQEEAPIAMGGMSIPGSVGFSYARVAGSAPSKGKYAKKTMASAQKGKQVQQNVDSTLENIFEVVDPTGISSWDDVYNSYQKSGMSPETKFEIFGALPILGKVGKVGKLLGPVLSAGQANKRLKTNANLVSNVMQSIPYIGRGTDATQAVQQFSDVPFFPTAPPAGVGQFGMYAGMPVFNKKEYGGNIPSAQNGQEMRFYQNGLDWKPKSMQNGGEEMYEGRLLPEVTVTPYDEQYPFYQTLSNEQKRYINDEGPIGRATRAIATTGKVGQTAKDISTPYRTVQEVASEVTGIPGTIRFAKDPVGNLLGLERTLFNTAVSSSPFLPTTPYNQEDLQSTFNTIDALGIASGMAAPFVKPVGMATKTAAKATREFAQPHLTSISNISNETLRAIKEIDRLKELEKLSIADVPALPGIDKVKDVRNFGKELAELESKSKNPSIGELGALREKLTKLYDKSKEFESISLPTPDGFENIFLQSSRGKLNSIDHKLNKLSNFKIDDFINNLKNQGASTIALETLKNNPDLALRYSDTISSFSGNRMAEELATGDVLSAIENFRTYPGLGKSTNFSPNKTTISTNIVDPTTGDIQWLGSPELKKVDNKLYEDSYGWGDEGDKFYSYPFYKNVGDKIVDAYSNLKLSGSPIISQIPNSTEAFELMPGLFADRYNVGSMLRQASRFIDENPDGLMFPAKSLSADSYPLALNMMARELKNNPDSKLRLIGFDKSNVLGFADSLDNPKLVRSELSQIVKELENLSGQSLPKPYIDKGENIEQIVLPKFAISKGSTNKIIQDYLNKNSIADRLGVKRSIKEPSSDPPANINFDFNDYDFDFRNGGIVKDNQGYWNPDNWGQPVEIDSNNITMEGVYEPLLGVSDTGDTKLMQPGKNYKFKGKKVTEFPVAKLGINQLDAQPMKKLNQLLNFTNNPDKDNWLDKYN